MRGVLKKEMKDLPFVSYKQHKSGVKEFDRWKEYPVEIKSMIDHILDEARGPKVPYPWEEKFPGLKDRISQRIKAMTETADQQKTPSKVVVTEEEIKRLEELIEQDGEFEGELEETEEQVTETEKE